MSSVLKTGLAVAEAAPPAKTSSIAVAEQVPREAVPTSTASPSVQEDFEVIEVSGQRRSEADRLKVSAEAVSVVELDDELRQVSGLADVLARSEGIVVQQGGGLGSRVRLSLNGLTDDQIPVFLDGLPLAVQGFGNLSLVPVNLIQRVEIYSGVVPVRFGADALGGAINLVSRSPGVGFGGSASYEVGSFMRQVATGALHYRDDERGWWVAGSGFYASAENDYTIDVLLADRRGNSFDAEARLFNNAFEQGGGTLEVGLTDRVRAKLLSLRFFANTVDREIQSDFIQSAPFAEVDFTQLDLGGLLRYRVDLVDQLELSVVAGFTRTERNLIDLGGRRVSWLGTCLFDVPEGGELNGSTEDVDFIDDGA
ncbi:MAG: TonB-dependent receptor plug domain-containing protein, partial [Myxococcota bacterium]